MNLIPHQLGLSHQQAKKLIMGSPIILPHHQMGAHAGEHIVNLMPQNARKLLTAFKKGKGLKLHLTPHEIHHTVHSGQGFSSFIKSVGNTISNALKNPAVNALAKQGAKYSAKVAGTALGAALGNPEAGEALGDVLGASAENAIADHALKGNIKGTTKQKAKMIAKDALEKAEESLPHSLEMIASQPSRRGRGIKNHHYTTKKGDAYHHIGHHNVLEMEAPYSGGKLKKGSAEMKERMARLRAMKKTGGKVNLKNLGKDILGGLKKVGHYVIPVATGALGAAGGEFLGGPLGGFAGSAAGTYAGNQINKKLGIGVRKRGRPRKVGGDLASMSNAYKDALKYNFGGLQLNNEVVDNQPISAFKTNPRVKPSPTEMTLSPYQRLDSPAMNPFIPTRYTQEGGTSCGYGGKGLYTLGGKGLYTMGGP
jgi:uncharacterized protein (DUF697 family)